LKTSFQDLPFQLSSRTISVPISEGKPERFAFQAVIIEISAKHVADLQERLFALGDPTILQRHFPYVGGHQFIPFLKSKEWSVQKNYNLARVQESIVQDLKPIFVEHLNDLRNKIGLVETLRAGFMGMRYADPETSSMFPLLHSIHNTANKGTKVALVPSLHFNSAVTQLAAVHSILRNYIPRCSTKTSLLKVILLALVDSKLTRSPPVTAPLLPIDFCLASILKAGTILPLLATHPNAIA
jgi:hypothetical protein